MLKQFIVLRGIPGSGKSTIAKEYKDKHKDSCFICSTDDYWVRPDGIYDFNINLLGKSHVWNYIRVCQVFNNEAAYIGKWDTIVILDNTNIRFSEFKKYIVEALKYGYEIKIIEPDTEWKFDVDECFKRNTHDVPYETIVNMLKRWESTEDVLKKIEELK